MLFGNNRVSLLDYDYVYNGEDNPDDYSALIYPTFSDSSLEDQSVSWETSNPLMGKIGPYKYDENNYPVYKDDDGKYCVRVIGYRKTGDFTITCISNSDNSIKQTINLYAEEAKAQSFEVKLSKKDTIAVNEHITVSATFFPKNTYQQTLRVIPSNDKAQIINDCTTSVTIKALKTGTTHFVVESISNDKLKYEFDLTFTAQETINDKNYSSFSAFMRKFAGHFSLFLVTAIFGMMFFYFFVDDIKKIWLSLSMTLVSGLFLAGLSELIQYFIPSRGGTITDIGIDSLGYLIGTALTIGVILLIRVIKNKIEQKKNKAE